MPRNRKMACTEGPKTQKSRAENQNQHQITHTQHLNKKKRVSYRANTCEQVWEHAAQHRPSAAHTLVQHVANRSQQAPKHSQNPLQHSPHARHKPVQHLEQQSASASHGLHRYSQKIAAICGYHLPTTIRSTGMGWTHGKKKKSVSVEADKRERREESRMWLAINVRTGKKKIAK